VRLASEATFSAKLGEVLKNLRGVIFCAIFAAVLAAALVGLLLHPAEVQQQAEKREGWNVFWLGRHVAIELFSDDATVTVYGPYCG
jgi:hypothetical protein